MRNPWSRRWVATTVPDNDVGLVADAVGSSHRWKLGPMESFLIFVQINTSQHVRVCVEHFDGRLKLDATMCCSTRAMTTRLPSSWAKCNRKDTPLLVLDVRMALDARTFCLPCGVQVSLRRLSAPAKNSSRSLAAAPALPTSHRRLALATQL